MESIYGSVAVLPVFLIWLSLCWAIILFGGILAWQNCGLIVASPNTLISFGDLSSPDLILTLAGLVFTLILLHHKVRGGVLLGIVAIAAVAIVFGFPVYGGKPFQGIDIFQGPAWPTDVFMQLEIHDSFQLKYLGMIFTLVMVDLFDTAGILLGLNHISKVKVQRMDKAFMADALATSSGAVIGTSSTTSYLESAAGITDGGRSGLTAVTVGILFFLSIFLWPLAQAIPPMASSPALLIIGASMMSALRHIDWQDNSAAFPAFLTIFIMPMSFSIANGIAFGVISFVICHVLTGQVAKVNWILMALALLLGFQFSL